MLLLLLHFSHSYSSPSGAAFPHPHPQAMEPFFSVLLSALFLADVPSIPVVLTLLPICGGVVLASLTEVRHPPGVWREGRVAERAMICLPRPSPHHPKHIRGGFPSLSSTAGLLQLARLHLCHGQQPHVPEPQRAQQEADAQE